MSVTLTRVQNVQEILEILRTDLSALQYTRDETLLVQQEDYAVDEWVCVLNGKALDHKILDDNTKHIEDTSPSKIARIYARAMHMVARSTSTPQLIPNRPMNLWEHRIVADYFLKHAGGIPTLNFIDYNVEDRTKKARAQNYRAVIDLMTDEYVSTTPHHDHLLSKALPDSAFLLVSHLSTAQSRKFSTYSIETYYRTIADSRKFTKKEKAIAGALRSIAYDAIQSKDKSIIPDWSMAAADIKDVASYLVFRELGLRRPAWPATPAP